MLTVGNAVKVTAVDVKTMTEATFQGPASSTEAVLQREALKKLEYVMRKKGLPVS